MKLKKNVSDSIFEFPTGTMNSTLKPSVPPVTFFCGLKVSVFSAEELRRAFLGHIQSKAQLVCYGYSLTMLPRFREHPKIHNIANGFDVMAAEGKGFYWLCKLFGIPLRCDYSLTEIMYLLLRLANENGFSVLLFGTDHESNRQATANVQRQFPNANVLQGIHGFYTQEEEQAVVAQINAANPDILLIGMSSPKKEDFVDRYSSQLKARIIVPLGGNIDVLSGRVMPIPYWVKKSSLTWLYRFLQEPRRLYRSVLLSGFSVIGCLLPRLFFEISIKRNKSFSIPAYYAHQKKKNKKRAGF
jgi:N-acetylglucosaminyldiphosphoundecaprenol N-acetyl-beta-D-mannosaminyltransferase